MKTGRLSLKPCGKGKVVDNEASNEKKWKPCRTLSNGKYISPALKPRLKSKFNPKIRATGIAVGNPPHNIYPEKVGYVFDACACFGVGVFAGGG